MPTSSIPPVSFTPIGRIRSCFKEKFGVPRQPGLIPDASAVIELTPLFAPASTVQGLDGHSHIWVIFLFHQTADQGWQPRVRPPRLGGNRKLGVYATRSMFRPNPIGLSVVTLDRVETDPVRLHVSGGDFVDGTPVLDIKPYVPYVEAISGAVNPIAPEKPEIRLRVLFSDAATAGLDDQPDAERLRRLISQVISADPRPAYRQGEMDTRTYGMRLSGVEVKWRVHGDDTAVVTQICGETC